MHFQVNDDSFYTELVNRLRLAVPDFIPKFGNDDETYVVLGEFADYLLQNLDDKHILAQCLDFIETALTRGGHETENAIVIQVFDRFYEQPSLLPWISERLSTKSRGVLKKYNNVGGSG